MLIIAILGLLGVSLAAGFADSIEDDIRARVSELDVDDFNIEDLEVSEDVVDLLQGIKVEGTDDADILIGNDENDTIFALSEDDVVIAGDGEDRVFGGEGEDLIFGGEGDDFIRGSADNDIIFGDAGNDTMRGDVGNDTLFGADLLDDDVLAATLQSALTGTLDQESLFNTLDELELDTNAETDEADVLFGGAGQDLLVVGSNDQATGGSGGDIFNAGSWMEAGESAEIMDFEKGRDMLVFSYEAGSGDPTVSFSEEDNGESAEVRIDGSVVMVLRGVDFSTLTLSDVVLQPIV